MAEAFAGAGAEARSFEIADDPSEDVLAPFVRRWLRREVDDGRIHLVWAGLPCATWSRARRNRSGRPGWPRPLRERHALWGLADLSDVERARVLEANRQTHFVLGLFRRCLARGTTMVVENPRSSLLWDLPAIKALTRRGNVELVDFDMRGFNAPWKKPSRLLVCNGVSTSSPHADALEKGGCATSRSRRTCSSQAAAPTRSVRARRKNTPSTCASASQAQHSVVRPTLPAQFTLWEWALAGFVQPAQKSTLR